MLSKIFKISLFWSSYIPIFAMVFLANLHDFSKASVKALLSANLGLWIVLFAITMLSLMTSVWWISFFEEEFEESSKDSIDISDWKLESPNVTNFLVLCTVPILTLKPESNPTVAMNLLIMLMASVYAVWNNVGYYNFWLMFEGYHTYTFNGKVVISKYKKEDMVFNNAEKAIQIGTTNVYFIGKIKD